ncbi:MAG TPA: quinone-dependent dihydroorotate dehydrogenase [Solirubrobacteraceae bacterium]|nr:quinone-dependent dihydroorotate dehydrogenase [Solirubrobacteraceae bacterium]
MYRALFHLVLRRLDPERVHRLAQRLLRLVRASRSGRRLLALWVGPADPALQVEALGRTFPSPLGVAAGLDKDGSWFEDLIALGFGFVEVGTVTARPQPGNPSPRIVRVIAQRALVNWMGFPNPGAQAVASRLVGRPPELVVGVNVGKSRAASVEATAADYRDSIRQVAPLADYIAVNVSSPNTPGLRELQAPERLRDLIGQIRAELEALDRRVPVLVKIAPDLTNEQLDAIGNLAVELELDGIVAVNTTLTRVGDGTQTGGLSGPPLAGRALEVLRRLRGITGDRLTLVSVGGVESAEDVWDRLRAGATLVQAYTGFVYGGPGWPRQINRQLVRRIRQAGYASVRDLLGADASTAAGRAELTS